MNFRRPTWDEYLMYNAIEIATRHSCLKRGSGAVLVNKENRIIATGYNGAASGNPSCLDYRYCYYDNLAWEEARTNKKKFSEIRELFKVYCLAVHAEMNAFGQVTIEEARGGILYLTNYPCPKCAQDGIITYKIKKVKVWKGYLSNPLLTTDEKRASDQKLFQAGISLIPFDLSKERIMEIASYMANHIGERTSYQFKPNDLR